MATKEELEAKYDECQETPDYVEVALGAFTDVGDKDWAVEVFEEGADWAATAKDFMALLKGARVILEDEEKTTEYFQKAKAACKNADEIIGLAIAAAEGDDKEGARELFRAAADKATKASEFLGLAQKITESLGDKELARELSAKGKEKCKTPVDFADLAKGLVNDFNDPEQGKEVLTQAIESCKTGADYATLAASAAEIFPDDNLGTTVYQAAEKQIETGLEMGSLAKEAVAALGDKEYAASLFGKAKDMLESGEDLMKLATMIMEALADKELTLATYQRASELFSTYKEFFELAGAVLKDTKNKDYAGQIYKKAVETNPDTPSMVAVAEQLADSIGDGEGAIEVLHQAENSVKTNAEFQVMGDAVLKYASEQKWLDEISLQKEKRAEHNDLYESYIKRELDAPVAAALWNLGQEVMQTTEDHPYVRKLFTSAEKMAKYPEDFITLAGKIVENLDDKEWAAQIYVQQFEAVSEFVRKKNIVKAVMETIDDQQKAKEYLKKMEEDCNQTSDYIKLATTVYEILSDESWARTLLQHAQVDSNDRYNLLSVAGKILSILQDAGWADDIYLKVADESDDKYQFEHLFQVVEHQTQSKETMEKLHVIAEQRLTTAVDLTALAESAIRRLGETPRARAIYKKAISSSDFEKARFAMAESVRNVLKDRWMANRIINA